MREFMARLYRRRRDPAGPGHAGARGHGPAATPRRRAARRLPGRTALADGC